MITTAMPSMRPMRATSNVSGVGSSRVASSSVAIAPISVSIAVAVITARALPCATAVPLKTMFRRSPSGTSAGSVTASFNTASLSPVSEASCTRSDVASSRRASAPTESPSPSSSRSPRTSSALGTRCATPSRITAEVACVMRASAATASRALASCMKPSAPLSSTTAAITTASTGQPSRPSSHQASNAIAIAASKR